MLGPKDVEAIIELATTAGNSIMEEYHRPAIRFGSKSDASPITDADRRSHEIITGFLGNRWPDVPVASEEGAVPDYEQRRGWDIFWLVDPLDGTKEFLARNGEFTVNIALVESGVPVFGIVYAPALEETYLAAKGSGAFKRTKGGTVRLPLSTSLEETIAVRSRSHGRPEERKLLRKLGVTGTLLLGSSLKFCTLAEGKAQVYYRHGPLWEWDTAAGHAILSEAGGLVNNVHYNTPTLKNERMLCLAPGMIRNRGEEILKELGSNP